MKTRLLVAALALLVASSLFAQARTNEAGLYVVTSNLDSNTIADPGGDARLSFSEKTKFGVSLNHFWSDSLSTEVALQKIGADMNLEVPPVTVRAGKLDATSVTALAQWHFLLGARFSPYVGAGVAHVSGHFDLDEALLSPGDQQRVNFESNTTWTAAVGANVRITNNLAFGTELKYVPWKPRERGAVDDPGLDVNPMTFSAGLRWRF